jgi:hypothetical protein
VLTGTLSCRATLRAGIRYAANKAKHLIRREGSFADACPENDAGCHSERVGQLTPGTASLQRRVSVSGFARFFAVLAGLRKVRDGIAQNDHFMGRGAALGM